MKIAASIKAGDGEQAHEEWLRTAHPVIRPGANSLLRIVQMLALTAVAGLLGLLVWRVQQAERESSPARGGFRSSSERTASLDGWLWHYNHRRRHAALGRQAPISRTNLLGSYSESTDLTQRAKAMSALLDGRYAATGSTPRRWGWGVERLGAAAHQDRGHDPEHEEQQHRDGEHYPARSHGPYLLPLQP